MVWLFESSEVSQAQRAIFVIEVMLNITLTTHK